jgi:hypothetical protein
MSGYLLACVVAVAVYSCYRQMSVLPDPDKQFAAGLPVFDGRLSSQKVFGRRTARF